MNYSNSKISTNTHIKLYSNMLLSRMIEEKMLILLRQGKISKWFSGIGQEAISVGITMAMENNEYILPMHRNLGVFPQEKYHFTDFFPNGKARQTASQKEETDRFILEQMNIILSV